jgi:flagellar motor switch protein FliN/FliY
MSFSASPLIPGQQTSTDTWAQTAAAVIAATTAALPQVPAADQLVVGDPANDVLPQLLPAPAGGAITGFIGGQAEGKVLVVVAQDLVDALSQTPFGALEPAKALRPALETLAEQLGGRLDGEPTAIDVADCLDVLSGDGTTVVLPLKTGDAVTALIGVSLTSLPITTTAAAGGAGGAEATAASAARSWGIDMLRDVEMEVTCELGRTRMTVRQLLALAPGDVVELDRLAGAPADLLVNGTLLARGEVVVVDESFGLRITEIVTRDAT